jgi:PIN domain nuclease of toxin-antitoxin system
VSQERAVDGSYLLDSNVLIWLDSGNERLTTQVRETLRYAEHRYLSAATAWELSLKQAAGKLRLRTTITSLLADFRLEELPVAIRHGDRAATLPFHHRDPFDRMLVAQAIEENLTLVTADRRLVDYGIPILFM